MKPVRTTHSRYSLLLVEMILAILFFALASAVCVQIFVKAHTLSVDTAARSQAVQEAQTAAEIIRSAPTDAKNALIRHSLAATESPADGGLHLYYDANWRAHPESGSAYRMDIRQTSDGRLVKTAIAVVRLSDSQSLYTLEMESHIPKTL